MRDVGFHYSDVNDNERAVMADKGISSRDENGKLIWSTPER